MRCSTAFTVVFRKHHCRACGAVICQSCSHYVEPELIFEDSSSKITSNTTTTSPVVTLASLRAVAAPPPATVRVCAPCAVSTHKVVVAGDVPVEISKVEDAIQKTPAYVYALYHRTEELQIGSLSVVCVQARGLPAADVNGLADPYVNLTLTGYTLSGGQEWPESMRVTQKTSTRYATLNPIWGSEHLHWRVPRAEAALRVEVFDYDMGMSNDLLGVVEIPLAGLLHQRRVDVWVPLVAAEDGESGGEIRLIMQYKFNRAGEALSRFWQEPPTVKEVVGFAPNRVYKHVVDLMEESKPYLALLAQVGAVLKWERPVITLGVFGVIVTLTLYTQYAFSVLQLLLVGFFGYMFVVRKGRQHARDVEEAKKKNLTLRDFLAQRRQEGKGVVGRLASLRSGVRRRRRGSSGAGGGKEKEKEDGGDVDISRSGSRSSNSSSSGAGEAVAEEQKKQQEEEQQGIASLGLVINFLGKRIGRSEATTNLQNALGMLVLLFQSIRKLFEWDSPAITAIFVLILIGSATMHLFVSVTWLFLLAEAMIFQLLTWPLQVAGWWGVRIGKVASSLLTQAKYAMFRKGKVPGEVVLGKEEGEEKEEGNEGGGKVKSE